MSEETLKEESEYRTIPCSTRLPPPDMRLPLWEDYEEYMSPPPARRTLQPA